MTLLPGTRRVLAGLVVTIAALTAGTASASASVISTSDAERPQGQEWASQSCADTSRVKQVTSPVAQGSHSYELDLQDGDQSWGERCELGMGNPWRNGFPLFYSGDDRWMSFQVYLPSDYPINTPNWNVFFQIHQQGDGGCPPLALHVEDGQFKLFNSSSPNYVLDTNEKWHAPAHANMWAKFTLHIKFSPDDRVGFVEMYGDLDGSGMKQLMPRTYMHTMTLYSDGTPMTEHARVGMYRDPAITGNARIFFDGFTIATDQAGAEANAFAGSGPSTNTVNPLPTPPAPGTTTTSPTRTNPAKPPRKTRSRVWLRSKTARLKAATSGPWPTVVPVYGGVRPNKATSGQDVIIEVRRGHHWDWLTRGRLRSDGRFFLTAAINAGKHARRIKLRAVVAGVGKSNTLSTRVH